MTGRGKVPAKRLDHVDRQSQVGVSGALRARDVSRRRRARSPRSRWRSSDKRRKLPGLLVPVEHRDPAGMPVASVRMGSSRNVSTNPMMSSIECIRTPNGDDSRVVVLGEPAVRCRCSRRAPLEYLAPCSRRSVRHCRTPQDDTQAVVLMRNCLGRTEAEHRVVVVRVVSERTVIDHFVAGLPQLLGQLVLDLEAGMVRRQVNAHPAILPGAFARNDPADVRRIRRICQDRPHARYQPDPRGGP